MADHSILSKETLIPLSAGIGIVFVVVSIVFYLTNIAADTRAQKEKQTEQQARIVVLESRVATLTNDQTEIKTKIDYIVKSLDAIVRKFSVTVSP